MNKWLWQGKPWQAFRSFAILFSFVVNFLLIVILFLVAPQLLPTVDQVAAPLVDGLSVSFEQMGDATIEKSIAVSDTLPISFTLPVSDTTIVRLTEPVPLAVDATFILPDGGGSINGTVSLELPAGLELPIALSLLVPVNQVIPVLLDVPVFIPLKDTDLGVPFGTLRALFTPLNGFVGDLPGSNQDLFDRVERSLQVPADIEDGTEQAAGSPRE